MTVKDVLVWLDKLAPFESQEEYDNSGLIVGNPRLPVTRVLFALDCTPAVVREAQEMGAELIVTHHPLMFQAVRRIRYDEPEGETLRALIGAGLNLIAAHTNWDRAPGGTSDSLAAKLGLTGIVPADRSLYLRAGNLPKPLTAGELLGQVNDALGACARLYGNPDAPVTRVAVGPGAAGEEYAEASAGAQAFVVGEIKHHQLLAALSTGLTVLEAGHYYTELPGLATMIQRFSEDAHASRWPVEARLTNTTPFRCTAVSTAAHSGVNPLEPGETHTA